jgi:hypothetical protein
MAGTWPERRSVLLSFDVTDVPALFRAGLLGRLIGICSVYRIKSRGSIHY